MSIKLMAAAWELDIPSTEKMVLLCLCDFAGDHGVCWPSVKTIARKCSKSERTVQGAIQWLRDEGYCSWDETPGKPHKFRLDPRSICTPAASAPPQDTTLTPAEPADKPSRTVISSVAKATSHRDVFPRPDFADPSHWEDFLTNRKTKRTPNTATAYAKILRDIEGFADSEWTPARIIEHAAAKGWAGIYDPREKDGRNGSNRQTGIASARQPNGFAAALRHVAGGEA